MNPATPDRSSLIALCGRIGPLDEAAIAAARERQDRLTKPAGALGRLERLSLQLAGITGRIGAPLHHKVVAVMAADHGVAAQGVSAYPQSVTGQMVLNFLRGGAAINVLARQMGAAVLVVDIGVVGDLPPHPGLLDRKIARGTRDFTQAPAMTEEECLAAISVGAEIVAGRAGEGLDLFATGEMGIGNTTPSSALVAAITGASPAQVTGRGTGVDTALWRHKVGVVERALSLHAASLGDPLDTLACLGGLEIAALAGAILEAAARRIPVVLDGFIATAAALAAARLCPNVRGYLIAAHRSVEPGHAAALGWLDLEPLLQLDLRLGEGTGAVLAFPIVEAAARLLSEMATFEEAGVEKGSEEVRKLGS